MLLQMRLRVLLLINISEITLLRKHSMLLQLVARVGVASATIRIIFGWKLVAKPVRLLIIYARRAIQGLMWPPFNIYPIYLTSTATNAGNCRVLRRYRTAAPSTASDQTI